MTSFKDARAKQVHLPLEHAILPPTSWGSEWSGKPTEDVALGLRHISDDDLQIARAEAAKYARQMHDDADREGQIEAFNDALMRWTIVRATCDANDTRLASPFFEGSEDNVRLALTSQAIRFLWDRIERFHLTFSPIVPEATDEALGQLAVLLMTRPHWDKIKPGAQKRFRKLAAFLLTELLEADPDYDPNPLDDDEDASTRVDDDPEAVDVHVEV